jgi:hypothetical protein
MFDVFSSFVKHKIQHAPLIHRNQSYMILPNGIQYTRRWMIEIIGNDLVRTIFDFAGQFNRLNLNDDEYALVFAIVLCQHGKPCYFND